LDHATPEKVTTSHSVQVRPGEDVRLLVFSVPMRLAPRALIECPDPDLVVEIIDQNLDRRVQRVQLRFKVRNAKTREVVKGAVAFRRIELDAEL
jgi:hypothetical protein